MTSSNPADKITYYVVVDGLDPEAQQAVMRHFETKRGGARPHDLSLYVSIAIDLVRVTDCLSWLTDSLAGRFQGIHIKASIETDLNWTEFDLPTQLVDTASRHGVDVKVYFASRWRASGTASG